LGGVVAGGGEGAVRGGAARVGLPVSSTRSRMTAEAITETAWPTPITTRAAISCGSVCETAEPACRGWV
jgi:hypothetical protein